MMRLVNISSAKHCGEQALIQMLMWIHIIIDLREARSPLSVLSCVCLGLLKQRHYAVINTVVIVSLMWSLISGCNMALFHCMVRHGTVRYGSLLGGFPLGTVPGTWYFFSTTSVEVPSSRTVTKTWRVNSADHWMAGENRHYCVTELATRDPPLPLYPLDLNQHSEGSDATSV